jgi:hypothetical protein
MLKNFSTNSHATYSKHGPGIRWEFVALTTTPKGWRVLSTLSTSAPAPSVRVDPSGFPPGHLR